MSINFQHFKLISKTVSKSNLSSFPTQHHFAEMISTYDQYGGRYMVTNNISEIRKKSFLAISAFGNLTINIQNVVY